MNKNSKKLIFGTTNKRQRYPIRKLTICAASVLLGTIQSRSNSSSRYHWTGK